MPTAKKTLAQRPKTKAKMQIETAIEPENESVEPEAASPVATMTALNSGRFASVQRQTMVQNIGRQQGNRQVQRMLSSVKPTQNGGANRSVQRTIDGKHDLGSPRFKGDEVLEACYDNERFLNNGDKGDHVKKVQDALLELDGAALPVYGADSIYGNETKTAVKKFQSSQGLTPDGLVGFKTMERLNDLFPAPNVDPPKKDDPPEQTTAELILQVVENADQGTLDSLRKDKVFMDSSQSLMTAKEFGKLCAMLMLHVPAEVVNKDAAKKEAIRITSIEMSGDKEVARNMVDADSIVVIIPMSKLLTDVDPFKDLKGVKTSAETGGRTWDGIRGVDMPSKKATAITEENLLGIDPTASFKQGGVEQVGTYDKGYSTTTHEFAHGIHSRGLKKEDKKTIKTAYDARKVLATAKPKDPDMWVDGPEGCYASANDFEFFAQLANAFLGTNTGFDATTNNSITDETKKIPRNNGKDWVSSHEPTVYTILDRVFAGGEVKGANDRK